MTRFLGLDPIFAIIDRRISGLSAHDLRRAAAMAFARMWYPQQQDVVRRRGWTVPTPVSAASLQAEVSHQLTHMQDPGIAAFLIECSLIPFVNLPLLAPTHRQGSPDTTCVCCGCTDSRACAGGCSWAVACHRHGYGVCSNCTADPRSEVWLDDEARLPEGIDEICQLYMPRSTRSKPVTKKGDRGEQRVHPNHSVREQSGAGRVPEGQQPQSRQESDDIRRVQPGGDRRGRRRRAKGQRRRRPRGVDPKSR